MQDAIARIAEIAQAVGDDTAISLAEELTRQLPRGELNLLVVGQFKRGKSTLVNALLGEDLMPTGALPITGAVTAVRYGADASIDVRLRGKEAPRRIALDELALYVSEHYNPGNTLGVERVDVSWPSERILGFALFDTPGVGSTLDHNTATARAALPRADAAILVVGPEPPIGAEELQYARDVLMSSEQLFVVLNKSDLAGDALAEVLEFTRSSLARILNDDDDADVIPLSATRARDAQRHGREDPAFEAFVNSLRRFLRDQGHETWERSAQRRAAGLVSRLDVLLAMRNETLNLPRIERQRRKALVDHALEAIDDRVRALELLVDDDVRHLVDALQACLNRAYDVEASNVPAQSLVFSKEPSSRRREALVEGFIREKASAWREAAIEEAARQLSAHAMKYARLLAELEVAVFQAGCKTLHVEASALEPNRIDFAPAKLELIASLVPTTGLELVVSFAIDMLPALFREPILKRRYDRILAAELDALRGKLRFGIARELEPWRQSTRSTIVSTVQSTRETVLRAFIDLSHENGDGGENVELARVREHQRELHSVRAMLDAHAVAG